MNYGTSPTNATSMPLDNDRDYIPDDIDVDDDNDGWSDMEEQAAGTDSFDNGSWPTDHDGDGTPDYRDDEDDDDG